MSPRKCILFLFTCLVSMVVPSAARAQTTLGEIAATLPIDAAKLVADPTRNRVYALVSASNSVIVIDTTTFKTTTVPVGIDPVDMAISPDDSTLYVANSGSTVTAVSVIDLDTLAAPTSFSLPSVPQTILAGPTGTLYITLSNGIYQVDSATGAVGSTFAYGQPLLLGSDGKTLFVDYGGDLATYDVSTGTPQLLQSSETYPGDGLVISHNGQYFCVPDGDNAGAAGDSTSLYLTADLTTIVGSFINTNYPGAITFALDDSVVYQLRRGMSQVIDVFNTQTFAQVQEATLPAPSSDYYAGSGNQLVMDNTGSYFFLTDTYFDSATSNSQANQVVVITTGTGTLTPPSILPVITSATSATGSQNIPFSYQITATNSPTSFNATGLPTGLSVDTTTGIISGTPTAQSYSIVTISASNASGTAAASLSLDIEYSNTSYQPVVTLTSLPDGLVGQVYSATISATNSPYYFSASGLPVGLSIDSGTGVISGTPTLSGTYDVTVSAENDYGSGSAVLSLTIDGAATAAPVITSAASATGTVGTPFSFQIVATNSPTGYTATGLPTGLSVNAKTGLISGTPSAAGQFAVVLGATNAANTGNAAFSLTISGTTVTAPVVSGGTAAGTLGVPFAYQIVGTNAPTSYGFTSYNGNTLPAGLTLNTASGLISGTPTVAGTFNLTLTATNLGGTGRGALTLTIAIPPAPVITSAATASVTVDQAFSYQIAASGTPTSFDAGSLPLGLSINNVTGLITGTPTTAGSFNVILSATNASGTGSSTLLLTVSAVLPTIDVVATVPHVTAGSGDHGEITISRTGDLSQKLTVAYAIKGSARNGTDYFTISGIQKIKPNRASSTIQIIPMDTLSGDETLVVKVTLLPAVTYQIGTATKAKVKIAPENP